MKQVIFLNIFLLFCNSQKHHISKRALLFPRATVLQFTYGLTVPLVLPRRSINLSACAQANYNLPSNISQFQPITVPARKYTNFFGISRTEFYKYITQYLDSFGIEGQACLLRTICEIAETPMYIKSEGTLLEKIVHFVFTPSMEMHSDIINVTKHDGLEFTDQLLLAETIGKTQGQCDVEYSDCLVSMVDIFSVKYLV